MATAHDVATAVTSALAEIGVTGEVDVTMDRARFVQWIGQPSSDDVQVVVTVTPLSLDDQ